MKRFGALIIFLLSFLTIGCHYNVPMVDVTATPPDIVQKIPLNVAILISDELENYTFTGQTANPNEGTYTFPFGQMIKKNAFDILSPAFNKAVLVKGKPYPQDIDAIVIPKVEKFQHRYNIGVFLGYGTNRLLKNYFAQAKACGYQKITY